MQAIFFIILDAFISVIELLRISACYPKKDEDGLVEFLKFNLMTTTAINKILPQVENAGMTSATAYLLNAINNAGGNQKTFKI